LWVLFFLVWFGFAAFLFFFRFCPVFPLGLAAFSGGEYTFFCFVGRPSLVVTRVVVCQLFFD